MPRRQSKRREFPRSARSGGGSSEWERYRPHFDGSCPDPDNGLVAIGFPSVANRGPGSRQALKFDLALSPQPHYVTAAFLNTHWLRGVAMARVTVEDCIDKVENRFDLVLLASHRARMISSGAQITIERDNDKKISPEDLREELVHSLQKYVEVDEPEPEAVPLIAGEGRVDVDDTEVIVGDRMTEEELLRGLEGLTPPEQQPEPMEPDDEE